MMFLRLGASSLVQHQLLVKVLLTCCYDLNATHTCLPLAM